MTIIFKNILEGHVFKQQQFLEQLRPYPLNSWLIRESQTKGMLTVEKRIGDDELARYRFAFVEGKWINLVDDVIPNEVLQRINYEYVTAESSGGSRQKELLMLFLMQLSNYDEFCHGTMVIPNHNFMSNNYVFFNSDGLLANRIIIEQLLNYFINKRIREEDINHLLSNCSKLSPSFFNSHEMGIYLQSVVQSLLDYVIWGHKVPEKFERFLDNNRHLELSRIWIDNQVIISQDHGRSYVSID